MIVLQTTTYVPACAPGIYDFLTHPDDAATSAGGWHAPAAASVGGADRGEGGVGSEIHMTIRRRYRSG